MNSLNSLVHNPAVLIGLYWLYNAAVSAMPEPMPNGSPSYKWVYGFFHLLAANLDKLAALKGQK